MKKVALFAVSGLLVVAGVIRFDLVAQESAKGGRDGPGPPPGEPHRVFPVQTELQRLILGKDISVFVPLDLRGVVKDGELDQAVLQSIRRDLAGAGGERASSTFASSTIGHRALMRISGCMMR